MPGRIRKKKNASNGILVTAWARANEEAVSHLNQTHMEVRHSEVLTQRKDEFRDTFGVQTETPEKME